MFSSDKWFGAEASFYNGIATQSLRFDDGSSHKLTRTFSSDVDNDKKMTISVWAKRGNVDTGSTQVILANYTVVRFLGELCFDTNTDRIRFRPGGNGDGSSNAYKVATTAEFRDVGSWYHIVLAYDTTQSTDTDRVKIYVNGEQQTVAADGSGQSFPPLNYGHEYSYNGAYNTIGEFGASFNSGFLDGYLSELNFIDGLTLDPTYFGETKNGVWIAKEYTGSYGTNGYRLEFKGVGGSADANGIGADTSGNGNHWSNSGFTGYDSNWIDSPENNFPTLNSISGFTVTLSEGNLKYTTGTSVNPVTGTISIPTTGKWYWEVYVSAVGDAMIGVQNRTDFLANGYSGRKTVYYREGGSGGGSGSIYIEGSGNGGSQASYTNGDVVSVLYNADDMKIAWYKNGSQEGLTFDVTDTDVMPIVYHASGSGSTSGTFNFGQDSTFVNTISQGGNSDANGIGDFKYTVPSGYLALCSANLPEPTIGPNSATQADDHFNTVLYTGNGSTQSITGVGFQPDWVWLKNRSAGWSHAITDSSRGVGKNVYTDATDAEVTNNAYGYLSSFDSDGFAVTQGSSGSQVVNASSNTYVAWNWKANGGTTSSNTNGSETTTVQANTTAGFSIVLYTGTGSTDTFGHGLGAVPKWFFTKTRSTTGDWIVYHAGNTSAPETDFLKLNENNATEDLNTMYNDTAPTSTVFTLSTNGDVNTSGRTQVGYFFAEVEGYSKFSSYTGNGNADGPFVFTGFRPAWVLIKNTARGADWRLHDIARQPTNDDGGHILLPNSSSSEVTSEYDIDFLSNGFKLKSGDVYENGSGELIIYAAFAEQPFKYANAR
jgi:hypothetical protein